MKEIIEAILKTSDEIPVLAKRDRNVHGKFNYVSIDEFYERVAPVARKHGLTWKAREFEATVIEVWGRDGKVSALLATYEFDLMHVSGEQIYGCSRITIVHPLQGAQTAGSAMSYAEKQFMREMFKVVTGEADADDTDNRAFDLNERPAASIKGGLQRAVDIVESGALDLDLGDSVRVGKLVDETGAEIENVFDSIDAMTDWIKIKDMAAAFLPSATSVEAVTRYWTDNSKAFADMKKEAPKAHKELIAAFAARKKELEG